MATNSLNHPKRNTRLPPKRGKIICLILDGLMLKGNHRIQDPFNSHTRKTKATKGNDSIKDGGILEALMQKLKGKNETPKIKNSSLPPKRGMIKVRIFYELRP
ncbi:hypothetical protein ACH5RR_009976 [Cinchona calisaya]|uniref:Metalloenzyme domain-containing protein n=1 Tax=Cinchona calisaya TaxID=153742 RepID=A0ABD3AFW8_9GENT